MISMSFQKASQLLSFRSLPRGLPSFCLWWGCFSRVTSNIAASPSPDFRESTPWSDEYHCLVPIRGVGVSAMVGGVVAVGPPIGVASWAVVAKRAAKDTFPITNCKGYMSTPGLLWDRLVKLLHMPPERIGDPTLPSL